MIGYLRSWLNVGIVHSLALTIDNGDPTGSVSISGRLKYCKIQYIRYHGGTASGATSYASAGNTKDEVLSRHRKHSDAWDVATVGMISLASVPQLMNPSEHASLTLAGILRDEPQRVVAGHGKR